MISCIHSPFRRDWCWSSILFLLVLVSGCSQNYDSFVEDLKSDNPRARFRAATKLSLVNNNPELVKKLIALLDDSNERTVFVAVQVLGSCTDTTAIPAIGRLITHPNPYIRESALQSIGLLGGPSALPYLAQATTDSIAAVRYMAAKMLGYIEYAPAYSVLYPLFRDSVDSVRAVAVQSVFMYHDNDSTRVQASDFAVPLTDPSDRVRFVTVQALGHPYPDSIVAGEMLISALTDENKHVRVKAIESLGAIRYPDAVEPLKNMYDLASVDEELVISETIKKITGEEYPPEDQ